MAHPLDVMLRRCVDPVLAPRGFSRHQRPPFPRTRRYTKTSPDGAVHAVVDFLLLSVVHDQERSFRLTTGLILEDGLEFREFLRASDGGERSLTPSLGRAVMWEGIELYASIPDAPWRRHADAGGVSDWTFRVDEAHLLACGRDLAEKLLARDVPTLDRLMDRRSLFPLLAAHAKQLNDRNLTLSEYKARAAAIPFHDVSLVELYTLWAGVDTEPKETLEAVAEDLRQMPDGLKQPAREWLAHRLARRPA